MLIFQSLLATNPGLAYATGRGIQEKGIRVNDMAVFQVHTERAGAPAELTIELKRPGNLRSSIIFIHDIWQPGDDFSFSDGQIEPVKIFQVSEHLYTCSYVPQRPGQYTMSVLYGGAPIRSSPFKVNWQWSNCLVVKYCRVT